MARDMNSSPKTGVDRWNATEKTSSRASRQPKSKGGSRPRNPQLRGYKFTLLALVVLLVVCAVGFMLAMVLIIISHRREEKRA